MPSEPTTERPRRSGGELILTGAGTPMNCSDAPTVGRPRIPCSPAFLDPDRSVMTHRQHPSWNKTIKRHVRGPSAGAQQAEAQRRLADGVRRPPPVLTPARRTDSWVDDRLAQQKEREASRTEAPDQTEEDHSD